MEIELTPFPSEDDRTLERGAIYGHLARINDMLHNYIDMVVFEKAAVALTGAHDDEHLICYGYYKLKLYHEGAKVCTEAAEKTDNLSARYWRGMLYREAGDPDAALEDLRVVADSDNGFRTLAAILMSLIYDERKDFRSSLDVLNRYTFLYAETQRKSDIAVSYNNRCFAYMQLGELRKALDDCNASLRYGSLPDAYRKQQELIRRLNAPDKGP
jgi:tetratricopeptide (TPR) repeat protein